MENNNEETQLILEYQAIERRIHHLTIRKEILGKDFPDDENQLLSELTNQRSNTRDKLTTFSRSPVTYNKAHALSMQAQSIIDSIDEGYPGLTLSRYQGLIFENAIYTFIVRDLMAVLRSNSNGWHIPYYHFTYKEELDTEALKKCLTSFKNSITSPEIKSYIDLEKIVEFYTNEITQLSKK